ncbi:hypothetical protein F8388_002998 [Cannabis sativa]|uniref:RNase H type-1 domain-containing protein n=1 Tax=Cannabis sativa TaxID=3483 RepID=A0A7J6H473_CANSA|nr:hypothetical protein F8388_002998 [Cannabis sativa]
MDLRSKQKKKRRNANGSVRNRSDDSELPSSLEATFSLQNPFEISNATPFEEFFPRHSSPDHSLQHAVNQFLCVHSPPGTTIITSSHTTIPTSLPSQTLPSTIPPPIMTTSTITHTVKGKGIALPTSSPPRTRPSGLVINEPSTQSSPTSSVGTRKHFTRQSTQDYQDAQIQSSISNMAHNHSSADLDHLLLPSTPALFVDAALSTNAPATGIGMVFMQGLSHIQKSARIFKPGASSPIFAETQALHEGLQLCITSNLTPRFIFSDCLNLVSKVNGNWHATLQCLLLSNRSEPSSPDSLKLLCCMFPRQRNGNAHSLAKLALRLRDED